MDSPSLEVVQADRLHRLQLGSSGSGVTTWALPRCPHPGDAPNGQVCLCAACSNAPSAPHLRRDNTERLLSRTRRHRSPPSVCDACTRLMEQLLHSAGPLTIGAENEAVHRGVLAKPCLHGSGSAGPTRVESRISVSGVRAISQVYTHVPYPRQLRSGCHVQMRCCKRVHLCESP